MKLPLGLTKSEFHFKVYYLSLCLLVISLPTSRFMITLSLILLAVNWLAEGNFRERFMLIRANKAILAFSGIYAVHLIGLFWTRDIFFALENDLLHKLPTLFLPWIIITTPIPDEKKTRLLLFLFIATVLVTSIIGMGISLYKPVHDFHETSPFISNIYFSLMLILAAFQLPLLIGQISKNQLFTGLGFVISLWFIFFLLYSRSFSGIVALTGTLLFFFILIIALNRSLILKATSLIVSIFLISAGLWLVSFMYEKTFMEVETDFGSLADYTPHGNTYFHDTLNLMRENGHLVYLYISEVELESAWNMRSKMDFQGMDLGNHYLKHTLYRYMASKGLKKDMGGMDALTDEDIRAVEHGTTNHYYLQWPGLYIRMHQMMKGLYMYQKTGYENPSWSTLTERIDLWKASVVALKKYPLFGWGTGSIMQAMDYGLEINDSALKGRNMKPHSQYFYTLLSLGFAGFLIVLVLSAFFIIKTGLFRSFIFLVLLVSCLFHFIANNALESQLGQNFFVLFTLVYAYFYPQLNTKREFIF